MQDGDGAGLPPGMQQLVKQLSAAISGEVAEILAARGLHGGAVAVTVVVQPLDVAGDTDAETMREVDHEERVPVAYAGWRRVDLSSAESIVVIEAEAGEDRGAADETSD